MISGNTTLGLGPLFLHLTSSHVSNRHLATQMTKVRQGSRVKGNMLHTDTCTPMHQISCIEYIHFHKFIHHDIKPNNFLMGIGRHSNQVNIIDFTLTKKYCDPKTHPNRHSNDHACSIPHPRALHCLVSAGLQGFLLFTDSGDETQNRRDTLTTQPCPLTAIHMPPLQPCRLCLWGFFLILINSGDITQNQHDRPVTCPNRHANDDACLPPHPCHCSCPVYTNIYRFFQSHILWRQHSVHFLSAQHWELYYTVTQKTVPMFATFDFLPLYLHN